jgi:hypothetical protein
MRIVCVGKVAFYLRRCHVSDLRSALYVDDLEDGSEFCVLDPIPVRIQGGGRRVFHATAARKYKEHVYVRLIEVPGEPRIGDLEVA